MEDYSREISCQLSFLRISFEHEAELWHLILQNNEFEEKLAYLTMMTQNQKKNIKTLKVLAEMAKAIRKETEAIRKENEAIGKETEEYNQRNKDLKELMKKMKIIAAIFLKMEEEERKEAKMWKIQCSQAGWEDFEIEIGSASSADSDWDSSETED